MKNPPTPNTRPPVGGWYKGLRYAIIKMKREGYYVNFTNYYRINLIILRRMK